MKDFIDTVKSGFDILPEILSYGIILGLISSIFNSISALGYVLLFFFGIWAIIFIGLPGIILILDIINRIFGLKNEE